MKKTRWLYKTYLKTKAVLLLQRTHFVFSGPICLAEKKVFRCIRLQTLLFSLLLVFAGCTGCGQKTAPPQKNAPQGGKEDRTAPQKNTPLSEAGDTRTTPGPTAEVAAPATPVQTAPEPPYSGLPPWPPIVIPPEVRDRSRVSFQHYEAQQISIDEHLENLYQIYVEELDAVTFVRELSDWHGPYSRKYEQYVEKVYAENPNDFETLLTWTVLGGNDLEDPFYGPEKTSAYRRLHEMNPHHPFVNHHLALSIYGMRPQEALGYAQKAQQLEPRYIPYALDGHCYYQMGDYEKALAAYQRAEAVVPAHLTRSARNRVERAKRALAGDGNEPFRERLRARGVRLMGTMMLSNNPL